MTLLNRINITQKDEVNKPNKEVDVLFENNPIKNINNIIRSEN